MRVSNNFDSDFFILYHFPLEIQRMFFHGCLALLDLTVCVTHAPRLRRGQVRLDPPFFLSQNQVFNKNTKFIFPLFSHRITLYHTVSIKKARDFSGKSNGVF